MDEHVVHAHLLRQKLQSLRDLYTHGMDALGGKSCERNIAQHTDMCWTLSLDIIESSIKYTIRQMDHMG